MTQPICAYNKMKRAWRLIERRPIFYLFFCYCFMRFTCPSHDTLVKGKKLSAVLW